MKESVRAANVAAHVAWATACVALLVWRTSNETGPEIAVSPIAATNRLEVAPADPRAPGSQYGFRWASLESTNFVEYIENLRGIGCPEETIRDIIISEINKLYAPRLQGLTTPSSVTGWGHRGDQRNILRDRLIRDIQREKRDILQQLLGTNISDDVEQLAGIPNYRVGQLRFLPEAKRERV